MLNLNNNTFVPCRRRKQELEKKQRSKRRDKRSWDALIVLLQRSHAIHPSNATNAGGVKKIGHIAIFATLSINYRCVGTAVKLNAWWKQEIVWSNMVVLIPLVSKWLELFVISAKHSFVMGGSACRCMLVFALLSMPYVLNASVMCGHMVVGFSNALSAQPLFAKMTNSNIRHPVKKLSLKIWNACLAINWVSILVCDVKFVFAKNTSDAKVSSMRRTSH